MPRGRTLARFAELEVPDEARVGERRLLYNYTMRAARLKMGLSQAGLAERTGIGKQTIGHIETFRAYPSAAKAKAISGVLGPSVDVLFPAWMDEFRRETSPSIETDIQHSADEIMRLTAGGHPALVDPGLDERSDSADLPRIVGALLEESVSPREAKVLRMRFGFEHEDGVGSTLAETGRAFGVTKERIRQIEAKALRRLRQPKNSRFLREQFVGQSSTFGLACLHCNALETSTEPPSERFIGTFDDYRSASRAADVPRHYVVDSQRFARRYPSWGSPWTDQQHRRWCRGKIRIVCKETGLEWADAKPVIDL